ncbi:hypothetical protein GW17_00049169 [Ensete ventricosum]|nr:hypothetical protein GW17_00049169 [Ensete ventricosum]
MPLRGIREEENEGSHRRHTTMRHAADLSLGPTGRPSAGDALRTFASAPLPSVWLSSSSPSLRSNRTPSGSPWITFDPSAVTAENALPSSRLSSSSVSWLAAHRKSPGFETTSATRLPAERLNRVRDLRATLWRSLGTSPALRFLDTWRMSWALKAGIAAAAESEEIWTMGAPLSIALMATWHSCQLPD